jgi:hypothetical protein
MTKKLNNSKKILPSYKIKTTFPIKNYNKKKSPITLIKKINPSNLSEASLFKKSPIKENPQI